MKVEIPSGKVNEGYGTAVKYAPVKGYLFLLMAGLVLLTLSVSVQTPVRYPEYVMDADYGTEIQKLVMGKVVGEYLRVDLLSDVLGLVILIVSSIGMFKSNLAAARILEKIDGDPDLLRSKGLQVRSDRLIRPNFSLFRGICICLIGLATYAARMLAPFFISGAELYGAEYALHFVVALAIALGMLHSTFGFTAMCENAENHRNNVLTEIWIVLTCICFFIYSMGYFYKLSSVMWIYSIAKVGFLLLTLIGLWSGRRYLYTGEFDRSGASSEELKEEPEDHEDQEDQNDRLESE